MVITPSFILSKEGILEVHFVTGEHLLITYCSNKALEDGAVNELNLKRLMVKFHITNRFLISDNTVVPAMYGPLI